MASDEDGNGFVCLRPNIGTRLQPRLVFALQGDIQPRSNSAKPVFVLLPQEYLHEGKDGYHMLPEVRPATSAL